MYINVDMPLKHYKRYKNLEGNEGWTKNDETQITNNNKHNTEH